MVGSGRITGCQMGRAGMVVWKGIEVSCRQEVGRGEVVTRHPRRRERPPCVSVAGQCSSSVQCGAWCVQVCEGTVQHTIIM